MEDKALHVNQTGENWEVENETGTLAQAETKQEAIEAARELASRMGAGKVIVHTADGLVESELSIDPPPTSV